MISLGEMSAHNESFQNGAKTKTFGLDENLITSASRTRRSGTDSTCRTEDGEGLFCSLCRKH